MTTADLLGPVSAALVDASSGAAQYRAMIFAPAGADGDVHVKTAWSGSGRYFVVKVATWFATETPATRATTLGPDDKPIRPAGPAGTAITDGYFAVHDARTGRLVAILDDRHHLTDVRTAAAAAISLPLLANPHPAVIGVLGTGQQAYLQASAALDHAPDARLMVWGRRRAAAKQLCVRIRGDRPRTAATAADSPEEVVAGTDLVLVATASRSPIVRGSWLRPGQHIVSVGADDLTKHELDADCFAVADLVVVDSRVQAPHTAGDLHAAVEAGAVAVDRLLELGQVLAGERAGRESPEQITVVKLVGLGVQDLAAAEVALDKLGLTVTTEPKGARP